MQIKGHILVLEDGLYNKFIVGRYLHNAGYSYDIENNCEAACRLADKGGYDAALIDCGVFYHNKGNHHEATASLYFVVHLIIGHNPLPIVVTSDNLENEEIVAKPAKLPFLLKDDWEHKLIPTLENAIAKNRHACFLI